MPNRRIEGWEKRRRQLVRISLRLHMGMASSKVYACIIRASTQLKHAIVLSDNVNLIPSRKYNGAHLCMAVTELLQVLVDAIT